jgi:hypothetical protein
MKVYLKVHDKQGGADLSTKEMDLDELIANLVKARDAGDRSDTEIPIMCDNWHRAGCTNPGGSHQNHIGVISLVVYKPR